MATQTNTSMYKLNHTMLRVKDPKASVKFYEDNFGMRVINQMKFEEAKFTLYFLAFDSPGAASPGNHWTDRESVLELTHNWGTENDPEYSVSNGNLILSLRFGHICFSVDNLEGACKMLEENGVHFQQKLGYELHNNTAAFALDPDSYWVKIIGQPSCQRESKTTNIGTYRFNHTMIRVKDPQKSLQFYRSVLGMSLLNTIENTDERYNVYSLGYRHEYDNSSKKLSTREGLVELTWNYGTEKESNFQYHNGNANPQGFGHLCVSVDDLNAACARFEELNVNWKKRLTDGRMQSVAFILDPDEYWIEVIQNEKLKKNAHW
ncbi:lactoylglutathione lyase [Geopyxis carbonaria]|nr:lactoylglutathione lyase [Geopyxis carbonaria]